MEGVGSEVSLKIRSAIKAKLVELGTYVDEELPDYIMVLVANKKTKDQMDDDLSLFLGHNTERFTSWLHHVLQKLNAAALLQAPASQSDEPKKKDTEEEKKKMKEEEKKREKDEAKKREKAEEMKKVKDEEKRKIKEKDKLKKKLDRKEKNIKVETGDEEVAEKGKKDKNREGKDKIKVAEEEGVDDAADSQVLSSGSTATGKKVKPLVRSKVSSADIFRAEAGEDAKEGEEEAVDDMLELRPAADELGLELAEEETAPKKTKSDQRKKIVAPRSSKDSVEVESRVESKVKKSKHGSPSTRTSAKERLGRFTPSKSDQSKDKPSVLDRLGSSSSSSSGRRIINLREESSFPPRSESSSNGSSSGMARAVSSAISSAQRSVCVLPASTSSGKKLEARVRPLMSKHVESSRDEHSREGSSRSGTSRVVSAVGAVLKRSHKEVDSDDEEYDPKKPMLSSMASKIEVIPRPKRPGAIQANTALILRAVADAHKSVNKSSRKQTEKSESPKKKHKGEIFTRSYREREQAHQKDDSEKDLKLRKIAITVPNATRKESEKHQQEEKIIMSEIGSLVTKKVEKRKPTRPLAMDEYDMVGSDDGYEIEMDGVEEGAYIERMDEQILRLPSRKVPVLPGDKTKFIVTMEGLDEDGYPVRTERPDIRSRLGARPLHNDGLEEVEEYIEEVEEWEEMDESVNEGNQLLPMEGIISDTDKPRIKSTITAPTTEAGAKKPEAERCKFWPVCKTGDTCPYHHPSVACKLFPNCKYGDKCAYIHPKCAYDGACTRLGCAYTHYIPKNPALVATSMKPKVVAPPRRPAKIRCRFFPKCTNMSCPYYHPKACYYGTSCKQANCPYSHPEIPTGAKLKWIAPKTSTTTSKSPIAAVEEKPPEVSSVE